MCISNMISMILLFNIVRLKVIGKNKSIVLQCHSIDYFDPPDGNFYILPGCIRRRLLFVSILLCFRDLTEGRYPPAPPPSQSLRSWRKPPSMCGSNAKKVYCISDVGNVALSAVNKNETGVGRKADQPRAPFAIRKDVTGVKYIFFIFFTYL